MVALAQVPPGWLRRASPILYGVGLFLLLLVAIHGSTSNGAQRWLDLKVFRFQPSEIMKLAVPMMCAWYLHSRPLPPSLRDIGVVLAIIVVPAALIAKQPDLGTALLVASAGVLVLFLAGVSNLVITLGLAAFGAIVPVAWHFMHDYQKQRVVMFLDPAQDPFGAGYHSIQSQIAIGSGGIFGKGWMHGSQAQLEFLPERSTDFIFAVIGEELGLLGQSLLILLYSCSGGEILVRFGQCANHVRETRLWIVCTHLLCVCLCEYRHGQRNPSGGRRPVTLGELWRHRHGDAAGKFRHPDVPQWSSASGGKLMRRTISISVWFSHAERRIITRSDLDLSRQDVPRFCGRRRQARPSGSCMG
jgi:cell division protein FtsW (lipid II flippase)